MADIHATIVGRAGVLTLDKPETLNALTHGMVRTIAAHLDLWQDDPRVCHVIIRSSGGRAFSAGGDIRDLYLRGRTEYDDVLGFFAEEYRLNTRIREYPKPYIALIDGIVMGGGVGVSVNGRYRVGTPAMRFAMPEVGIGFFPDVGATYFLPRFPGWYGRYCALTGARLKQAEAAASGVITHCIDTDRLEALFAALTASDDAPAVLEEMCDASGNDPALPDRDILDRAFAGETVEAILERLDGERASVCAEAAATIRAKSPTSVKIALRQMQVGAGQAFRDCMTVEFRIVSRVLRGHDFYEGVRATIVDKDNRPAWRPDDLAGVSAEAIDAYFEPADGGDLRFD
ncbi:MAG: enoyl-CoA hydratase/isomerase family protein [Pseudomonadota bacterium]